MDGNNQRDLIINQQDNHLEDNSGLSKTPSSVAVPPSGSEGSITWTASEFIDHQKSLIWYVILLSLGVVFAAIIYIFTKDTLTSIVIVVAALLLMIGAAKKPHEQEYKLNKDGLYIANKLLAYDKFRSFSVIHQGAFSSIVLVPLKRFSMFTEVFYDPNDEAKIIAILSEYLPFDEKKRDWFDQLMWKIKY